MKHTTLSIVILACLVVVLLIAAAFTAVSSASAQLGNTGVPVRCFASITSGGQGDLVCHAADGTPFGDHGGAASVVPTGHYLLVTDVLISPAGAVAAGGWRVTLFQLPVDGIPQAPTIEFRAPTLVFLGEHFTTPYFVVPQNEYLGVSVAGLGGGGADVYVSGLLTANVIYSPMIAK